MASALAADTLLKALRDEGCKVVEYKSWRTHRRPASTGGFGPINGVMIHHTVTSGTSGSVALCYNGHSSLPGPLCHGVIDKDGTVWLVSNGRANHAGLGDDDVLRQVQDESYDRDRLLVPNEANTDGNSKFYGFECINLGNGQDPWPEAQRDAIVRASAAILRAYGGPAKGWTAKSVIGHKEWQPGKIDPRTGSGGVDVSPPVLRRLIDERLAHPASWNPGASSTPEEDDMTPDEQYNAVWRNDRMTPPDGKATTDNPTWAAESVLREAATRAARAEAVALRVEQKLDQLETTGLTDEQMSRIADLVADKLAARLAS